MKLSGTDKKILETLFNMRGGYVLDFSDRRMESFFDEEFGIKVYDAKYDFDFPSKSKANRLRGIWLKEDEKTVGKIIISLVDYLETSQLIDGVGIPENTKELAIKAREIGARLLFSELNKDHEPFIKALTDKTAIIKNFNSFDFNTLKTNQKIYLLKVLYSHYEGAIRAYYGSGLSFLSSGIDDLNDYFKVLRKRIIELIASDSTFSEIKDSHAYSQVIGMITSLYTSAEFLDVLWHDNLEISLISMREDIANKDLFENNSEVHKAGVGVVIFLQIISKEIETMSKYLNQITKNIYTEDLPKYKENFEKASGWQKKEEVIKHEHVHRFENSIQEKDISVNVHNINDNSSTKKTKNKFPFTIQAGTTWESLYIQFKNDDAVTIKVSGHTHDTSFADMGFADGRTNKPNTQWALLKLFAKNGGSLTAGSADAKDKYKKHKQLLSDALKNYFSIDYDPFKPYGKTDGYTIKANLSYPNTKKETPHQSIDNEVDEMFQELVE